jgi:homoserine/homoserine lactone efflux protein
MVIQLFLTGLGMSAFLGNLAQVFALVRWAGVAYLVYLGVVHWCAAPVDLSRQEPQMKSFRAVYLRGFLVSLTNPKTLLFFGAFFPQFLVPDQARAGTQMFLLSATFLSLALVLDGAWALGAGRVRGWLARHGRLRNRISGGMLIGAGAGLALARKR